MRKKIDAVLFIILALTLITGTGKLAAMGGGQQSGGTTLSPQDNFNETGFPIVKEKITLKFLVPHNPEDAIPYMDIPIYREYEQKTNIHVELDEVPQESWPERYRLILASNDLPDVIAPGNVGTDETFMATYARQGTFLPLEGLIDKYGANARIKLNERADVRKFITSPDGHIYSLPYVDENLNLTVNDMIFINKTWLDQLRLPEPKTLDEYANYLRAVKNMGKTALSLGVVPGSNVSRLSNLFGSFGITEDGSRMFVTDNDKILYSPTTNEYRNALQYFAGLYAEGLIDPESFTQSDAQLKAKAKVGIGSSIVFWYPALNDGDQSENEYIIVGPFTGPNGHLMYLKNGYIPGISANAFLMTRNNKFPEATMRWVDYWLDNGDLTITLRFGPEGYVWEKLPNNQWTNLGTTPDGNIIDRKFSSQFSAYGILVPYWQFGDLWSRKLITAPDAAMRGAAIRSTYSPVTAKPLPPIMFSDQDNRTVSQIQTSLNTYVSSSYANFITQGINENAWQEFTARCRQLGSDRLVELYQQYYDEFNAVN